MEYKIVGVSSKVDEWSSQYGQMKTYYLKLDGVNEPIKLNQKDSSPAPQTGQTLNGSIQEDKFGKKFKKESNFGASNYSANTVSKTQKNDDGMAWGNALTNAVAVVKAGLDAEEVLKVARVLFDGRNEKSETKEETKPAPKVEKKDDFNADDLDEINLDDIPF